MDFLLSSDLKEFRETLHQFFLNEFPFPLRRERLLSKDGFAFLPYGENETLIWEKLTDLGVLPACVPEEFGGLGFGALMADVIIEQAAIHLVSLPLFETICLGLFPLLLLASQKHQEKLLPSIASGELRLTGAFYELWGGNRISRGEWFSDVSSKETSSEHVIAEPVGPFEEGKDITHLLSGVLNLVPSVSQVDAVLVPAIVPQSKPQSRQLGLYLVSLKDQFSQTIVVEPQPTFDVLRSYSHLELHQARATLISAEALSKKRWTKVKHYLALLAASELVGIARRIMDVTLEYAKIRNQFGRPIGSFQAIAHKLVDMHFDLQNIALLTRFAAWSSESDENQFPQAAMAAKGLASEVAPRLIETALQVHGGIGFTYEYDLHLYLRRAKALASLYGEKTHCYGEVGRWFVQEGCA